MKDAGLRVRFAPSPTGSLHLGNARTALFNWLVARRSGGRLILRIEDTDTERGQEGSEAGILEDLRWLGLDWDEGPDVGGARGPYRQSERLALYERAAKRLLELGRVYRCFCTAEDLEAERSARQSAGAAQQYSGRCRRLSARDSRGRALAGESCALRFATAPEGATPPPVVVEDRLRGRVEFDVRELGDWVILRPDGRPTYNFAVVVDDAEMEIDLVLRGDDHLSNAPRQVQLYEALGFAPPEFAHVPMVRGADGGRLSKRHGAVSVAEYRRMGYPAEGLLNALVLLGWSPGSDRNVLVLGEMLSEFSVDRIHRAPSLFDASKLDWISNQHLKRMPVERLASDIEACLVQAGKIPPGAADRDWLLALTRMLQPSLHRLTEVLPRAEAVFVQGGEPLDAEARAALASPGADQVVRQLGQLAEATPPEDTEGWARLKAELGRSTGLKGSSLFHPIRAALTGRVTGPELDALVPLVTRGSRLFPEKIASVADRARRTTEWLRT